jgi:hypothetical protein
VTYPATFREARRLRRLARAGDRRAIVNVFHAAIPGFRPWKQALPMLVEAVRIEPTILVEPRLVKVLFPALR